MRWFLPWGPLVQLWMEHVSVADPGGRMRPYTSAYKVFLNAFGCLGRQRPGNLAGNLRQARYTESVDRKRAMKDNERFWNVDLRVLLLQWWQDIWVFAATALTFVALAIPVIIPALILWF